MMKGWVNDTKLGNRRLLLLEYNATVNIMEAIIKVIGLAREPTIIIKDVL